MIVGVFGPEARGGGGVSWASGGGEVEGTSTWPPPQAAQRARDVRGQFHEPGMRIHDLMMRGMTTPAKTAAITSAENTIRNAPTALICSARTPPTVLDVECRAELVTGLGVALHQRLTDDRQP